MRAEDKILSFKSLKKGWHFGEGVEFNESIIQKAILLNTEAKKAGYRTNAFPGINGEVQVTCSFYELSLEFTIESW